MRNARLPWISASSVATAAACLVLARAAESPAAPSRSRLASAKSWTVCYTVSVRGERDVATSGHGEPSRLRWQVARGLAGTVRLDNRTKGAIVDMATVPLIAPEAGRIPNLQEMQAFRAWAETQGRTVSWTPDFRHVAKGKGPREALDVLSKLRGAQGSADDLYKSEVTLPVEGDVKEVCHEESTWKG